MSLPLAPPAGMRDLLPPAAETRAWLSSRLGALFRRYGYSLVTTPPFEHAEVIERGLDVDPRDLLRFVEPHSGEVALLRPDITPQIARIVATSLRERPPPWRLSYSGSLVRQPRARARKRRLMAQAGVEHVGDASLAADVEILTLACEALSLVGLDDARLELSLPGLPRAELRGLEPAARADAEEALAKKDRASLESILRAAKAGPERTAALLGALRIDGDVGVLRDAARVFKSEPARAQLRRLRSIVRELESRGLGERLGVDLSEVRGASYYTGMSFVLLADGPGEAIGAGGRYDDLLGRFGAPAPATGFGLDLGNLEWALAARGRPATPERATRVVVAAGSAKEREETARRLRESGIDVATHTGRAARAALEFAGAWGFDGVVTLGAPPRWIRVDGRARRFSWRTVGGAARWLRERPAQKRKKQ